MALQSAEFTFCRLRLKCDGTRAETRFRLSAKRTSPFKSAGASVQSTTGSRGVRIGGSNAGYTMFRGSVKGTGYPLHSAVSPSFPLPCVTVCHHISTGLYPFVTQLGLNSTLSFKDKKRYMSGIAEGHKTGNAGEKVTESLRKRKLSTLSEGSQPWSVSSFSQGND